MKAEISLLPDNYEAPLAGTSSEFSECGTGQNVAGECTCGSNTGGEKCSTGGIQA